MYKRQGHAADSDLYFRVLDTKTQKVRSHFLVFGFDGNDPEAKIPDKVSIKTIGRRLRKVNRLIRKYRPEPLIDALAAKEDLSAIVRQDDEHRPIVELSHRGVTLWAERYSGGDSDFKVAFSPKHQTLYVSWIETDRGRDGYTIYRVARKSIKQKMLPKSPTSAQRKQADITFIRNWYRSRKLDRQVLPRNVYVMGKEVTQEEFQDQLNSDASRPLGKWAKFEWEAKVPPFRNVTVFVSPRGPSCRKNCESSEFVTFTFDSTGLTALGIEFAD